MAKVELTSAVLDDLGRFADHMNSFDVDDVDRRIDELVDALRVLQHSPWIGRTSRDGKRELVIGRGARGYIALYRYIEAIDTVVVLSVRAQREDGYKHSRKAR